MRVTESSRGFIYMTDWQLRLGNCAIYRPFNGQLRQVTIVILNQPFSDKNYNIDNLDNLTEINNKIEG